ncbi:pentachlorophenol 4-monooxygenase [Agrocybe pediades]|nr:pentachlorophenol 4-monooxygenase [Agrocybe pediades]
MAAENHSPKVLIVGGGPSGLILALSLLHNGVPVRIIEKTSQPRLGQRGAGLMPRTLELFSYLRIVDDVTKIAIQTPRVRLYRMPGGVEVKHEFEMSPHQNPTPTHPYLNPLMLGQDRLESIFHKALASYGCSVELGTELKTFEQNEHHVRVKLVKESSSGGEGEHEEAEYDWMIGTDGARGVVRKQLGLSFLGETRNIENFIVGDIIVDGLAQKATYLCVKAPAIRISLRGTETSNLFNFVVGGKNVNHAELSKDPDALRRCFMQNTGNRADLKFCNIPWMSHYTPNIRMVDKFGYGRVYIAGDAGHVHSPTGGQGVNTGIQDSFNLGWKLALVVKGIAPPSLLQSFSEERIPVIAEMINQTTKLLKRTLDNEPGVLKTNGTLYQLGVNYRWSSIVVDERKSIDAAREAEEDAYMEDYGFYSDDEEEKVDSYGEEHGGRLRAGDRAPDSSGLILQSSSPFSRKSFQLFQIFDAAHHTILIFSDIAQHLKVLQHASRYPESIIRTVVITRSRTTLPSADVKYADYVFEDRDGHAYESYCPTNVCGVCIVRPDGVLGAIVKDSVGMHRYFQGIFGRV